MNNWTTDGNSLRRVGTAEAALHALGAAVVFAGLAQPFADSVRMIVPVVASACWAGWYGALRVAKLRDWFGAWDCASFAFVSGYAAALSLALVSLWSRWG